MFFTSKVGSMADPRVRRVWDRVINPRLVEGSKLLPMLVESWLMRCP